MSDECGCCRTEKDPHPLLEVAYDAVHHGRDDPPMLVCPRCDAMDRWPVNQPKG